MGNFLAEKRNVQKAREIQRDYRYVRNCDNSTFSECNEKSFLVLVRFY